MSTAATRHLRPLPATPAPPAPLPRAAWAAYQQELFEAYLVSRRATVGASAVHGTLSALRANFLPWLAAHDRHVWEVTPADLDAWALALRNTIMTRTHQQYFAQVACFYDWLVARKADELWERLGVQVRHPVDRFNRARRMPEGERLVPVPREEAITFFLAASRARIAAAPSDAKWLQACRDHAIWQVLNWAGLRRSELAALARADIDLEAGLLRVVAGKYGKGRLVHLQPPLAPILRWYLHDVRPQEPPGWRGTTLFRNQTGRAFHPDSLRNLLHAAQVQAGLPAEERFTCHGFRRAYATRLYKALRRQAFRDPLIYVKEQLGHAYLSTTQRYCQLDDDYRHFLVRDAAAALAAHYEGGARDDQVDPARGDG